MNKKAVFFGELLMRLTTRNQERFVQSRQFDVAYTGAEANAAVSLANYGGEANVVSAVPAGELGDACINFLRQYGLDTRFVARRGSRLGILYVEPGASQRPSKVIYDRAGSAITELTPDDFDWPTIFSGKDWLHLSGTAPALSESMAATVIAACKAAHEAGARTSIDMNYRKKLWRWDPSLGPRELAEKTMREILPHIDLIIGNEEDAHDVLGIRAGDTEVTKGELDIGRYPEVAKNISEQFPQASFVAITLRESLSASANRWGAMLYDCSQKKPHFAPLSGGKYAPYTITPIVDRVGGGDSFSGALIYQLLEEAMPQEALDFAVAASCLKHAIPGDFNLVSKSEVLTLAQGDASGRVQR